MTPMAASSPIIQNHPSKLSWLTSNAMAQVKTLVPQMAISALIGYSLNWAGLKMHDKMDASEAAAYFAMLPIISSVTEPIFKRLVFEHDCKNDQQLAARRTIRATLSRACSPFLMAVGYNFSCLVSNYKQLSMYDVFDKQKLMLKTSSFLIGFGSLVIAVDALLTLKNAYHQDSLQNAHSAPTTSGSEAALPQSHSFSPDKGLRV